MERESVRKIGDFKLVQVAKSGKIKCELLTSDKICFEVDTELPQDRIEALMAYVKNDWDCVKKVELEYDSLDSDGKPINVKFIQIKHH